MGAALQGAFVVIPGIPRSNIFYMIIKKRIRFLVGILYSLFLRVDCIIKLNSKIKKAMMPVYGGIFFSNHQNCSEGSSFPALVNIFWTRINKNLYFFNFFLDLHICFSELFRC